MSFNWIDAFLALVVLLGLFSGWARGFVFATVDLLVLAASFVAAFMFYRYPQEWLQDMAPALNVWIPPIAFVATFVLVHLVLSLIERVFVNALPRRLHAHGINRFLGLAPGAVNGLINATVVSVVLLVLPFMGAISNMARESVIASYLSEPAQWVEAQLSPIFDPAVRRTLQALTPPQPESRTSVPLKFRTTDAQARPDLEARMLEMVNAERAKAGLKPLRADAEMTQVARKHSADMLAQGYFSHVSPDGKDLTDRIRREKLLYLTAGENLAYAPTLAGAHRGLMNSPGHRANILRPQFGRLGIGVLDAGPRGLMVTQNFRN
jgi:uncharacterized protein YkwD